MAKLSELRTAAEAHQEDMADPAYRFEYERTQLASDVALRVLAYRTEHGVSQTELARRLGMRQPNIARLESGEHEPSLATLARLSYVLGTDFSVDITPGGACLAAPRAIAPARRRERAAAPAHAGAVLVPAALVATGQAEPSGRKNRMTASPARDQKAACLRDLERLRDLIRPYSGGGSAPISHAIARMPAAERAEARDILTRIGTLGEDPDRAAAREQILLSLAQAEALVREILDRGQPRHRGGEVLLDPQTGEPLRNRNTDRRAVALLRRLERQRAQLTGLPPAPLAGETS